MEEINYLGTISRGTEPRKYKMKANYRNYFKEGKLYQYDKNKDIFTINPQEIEKITVTKTIVGNEIMYELL